MSCFGGKREIMEHVSPLGQAQHSGTYNGHLIEIMAGNAFFDLIASESFYPELLGRCERFYREFDGICKNLGFPGRVQHKGARFSLRFGPIANKGVRNYRELVDNDWGLIDRFYVACLKHGVYFHTMQHHGLSSAHTDPDIDRALTGIEAALTDLLAEGLETEKVAAAPF